MSTVISDDDAKRNISANVRAALALRKMTQAALARATDETEMTISNVVRGVHDPRSALLCRIAEALKVSTDWLLAEPVSSRKAARRRSLKPEMTNTTADVHRPKNGDCPMPKQTA